MYRGININEGLPPRIYREPREIIGDIERVRSSIDRINNGIDVRELLWKSLPEGEALPPEKLLPILESALSLAEDGLHRLSRLEKELFLLKDELYDTKCEMGI